MEANMQDARNALESLSLEDNERIVSLDTKSFYPNVRVGEAIEVALRELYSSNLASAITQVAMKSFLRLAVTNAHI